MKRKLGNNCHEELAVYIKDPKPNTNKPLKNINTIADSSNKFMAREAAIIFQEISKKKVYKRICVGRSIFLFRKTVYAHG